MLAWKTRKKNPPPQIFAGFYFFPAFFFLGLLSLYLRKVFGRDA
jgi:hypothetical protein